ncbi:Nucleolar protein 12 [Malassezia nana]|uniref:Nucleolar protein 12 n=1 Tax=Malassezia nana TaxID=180528 RepID=A0AAF0EPT9_9BASI|nr:Nucleolar protein 12 [Malassezia nana]
MAQHGVGTGLPLIQPGAGFDAELDAMFQAAPMPPRVQGMSAAAPIETKSVEAKTVETTPAEDLVDLSGLSDDEYAEEAAEVRQILEGKDTPHNKKAQLEPADESDLERNKRTIFVGNVPVAALTTRSVRKQFLRHIEAVSPYPAYTQVVSLRFRSVSFNVPTSDAAPKDEAVSNGPVNKRRERARLFRERKGEEAPPPLTAPQKRKIAYIRQALNERAESVHAYVRLGDPALVRAHRRLDEPLDERLSVAILAALLARALDNTVWEGRHLRADTVQPLEPHEMIAAGLDQVHLPDGTPLSHRSASALDPKRTIFVGNLDFEAQEEEVRALFEKLVREERGEPPLVPSRAVRLDGTPVSDAMQPGEWVESVRIVRDKATQLGKGFAYVKFIDTLCVDEIMALHEAEEAFIAAGKHARPSSSRPVARPIQLADGQEFRRRIKLRKRALRISRCKTMTGVERKRPHGAETPRTPPQRRLPESLARARSSGAPTPHGSSPGVRVSPRPDVGSSLAMLSKEERAARKKSDPARQARRLEKKQAKRLAAKVGQGRERVKLPQRSLAKKLARAKRATS